MNRALSRPFRPRHSWLLAGLLSSLGLSTLAGSDPVRNLKLLCRDSYLPGVPVLLRVEIRNADGRPARELWDGEAALSPDRPEVTLTPNRVKLWNGAGSALVSISPGAGDVQVTASAGELSASRLLRSLEGQPVETASGSLAAAVTEWSGIVQVSGPLAVPPGKTLRLLPGLLVLVSGVQTGEGQPGECQSPSSTPAKCGASITVNGKVESLGTEDQPVTITARETARAWGEINHKDAAPSIYRFTEILRAGNSPAGGHTGTGPAVRAGNSAIRFENCSIADTAGKSMQASGSSLEFYDCLLARSIMGPEIGGTGLIFERCWVEEMYGSDDNDGIYLHSQRAGQTIALRDCVIASGDDDGIDTLGSNIAVERCLVRDFKNPSEDSKGISVFSGSIDLTGCLLIDNKVGISGKGQNGAGAALRIDRSTISSVEISIEAKDKFGEPDLKILYFVSSCIIQAPDAVRTNYPPGDLKIAYSAISETWPGEGNIAGDPQFVDPAQDDYRLAAGSPCIDAGDPALPLDPDGTRADMGAFYHPRTAAAPRFIRGRVNGDAEIDLADAVALLLHLFHGRPLACREAADANDDEQLDVSDALAILAWLFLKGPALPPPAATCGEDPNGDGLDCASPGCA